MTKRVVSIDILRGLTVCGMILVNNPGDWGAVYAPLRHAEWIGLTPTDLVYPTFMLVMGMSMNFSLGKQTDGKKWTRLRHILRRSCLLFLIGLFIHWFGMAVYGNALDFSSLRIPGVLQRLALSYLFAGIMILALPPGKTQHLCFAAVLAAILLAVYQLLLTLGNGFAMSHDNIAYIIDASLLGPQHLYTDWLSDGTSLCFDPEGLLGTMASTAHVLLGYIICRIMCSYADWRQQTSFLLMMALSLIAVGMVDSTVCPVMKKTWTPSFVLVTVGIDCLVLSLIAALQPRSGNKLWLPLLAVGMNPLALYTLSEILSILAGIPLCGSSLQTGIFTLLAGIAPSLKFASLLYALCDVSLFCLLALILKTQNLIIKL